MKFLKLYKPDSNKNKITKGTFKMKFLKNFVWNIIKWESEKLHNLDKKISTA